MTGVVERQSARVILLDGQDRVLLLRWVHPSRPDGVWWITPGGGLEAGEDARAGAVRELFEEVGLALTGEDLGGPVFERDAETVIESGLVRQHEVYFTARVDSHDVVTDGWTPFEVETITGTRWWTRAELAATTERIAPANLVELLP
jgi:8-oxo-dGTP pyrophosphatase MutT (NUDIX family)